MFYLLNRAITFIWPPSSLMLLTWIRTIRRGANARRNAVEYLKFRLTSFTQSPGFIFTFLLILIGGMGYMNLTYSFRFYEPVLTYLNFIKLDRAAASNVIEQNFANTSSIVGLSFVVIGFLFEMIKDKSGIAFNEFVRTTRLYWSLFLTLISIAYLATFNLFKFSIEINHLKNIAISSYYVVVFVLLAIAWQLNRVVTLLNASTLQVITAKAFKGRAYALVIKERLSITSRSIIDEFYIRNGVSRYRRDGLSHGETLNVSIPSEKACHDVNFMLLGLIIKLCRFGNSSIKHSELHLYRVLHNNEALILGQDSIKGSAFLTPILRISLLLSNNQNLERNYLTERREFAARLANSAETGDIINLGRNLDIINDLYDIYLQNRT